LKCFINDYQIYYLNRKYLNLVSKKSKSKLFVSDLAIRQKEEIIRIN